MLIRTDSAGGTHEFRDMPHRTTPQFLGRVQYDPHHAGLIDTVTGGVDMPMTPTASNVTGRGWPSSPGFSTCPAGRGPADLQFSTAMF